MCTLSYSVVPPRQRSVRSPTTSRQQRGDYFSDYNLPAPPRRCLLPFCCVHRPKSIFSLILDTQPLTTPDCHRCHCLHDTAATNHHHPPTTPSGFEAALVEMLKEKYKSPFSSPSKATAASGFGVFAGAAATPSSSASVGVTPSTAGNPSSRGRGGLGEVGSHTKRLWTQQRYVS